MLQVSALYIYPIKSLAGIPVRTATLTDKGFANDRRWMLVDENNHFLTAREYPEMALIRTELRQNGLFVLSRDSSTFHVPLQPSGDACTVKVWEDVCEARYVDAAVDTWFSRALNIPCRLVYMPETTQRKVDPDYAHQDEITSFSDGFPLLLIGQASLDDLNSRMSVPLPMERFRPNIVFTGGAPYQEDEMKKFKIGNITFYGVKPCARCVMTTIDTSTGEKGKEPLRTLSQYRLKDKKVLFGQNLLIDSPFNPGPISIGDVITIL
ncbi:MAG TPA: MOSC N-terminal beta barrel domain-containing protein [Puia sp.]|nr:MOSC N-terminal beta barrel domain-containing protein [Puia sp.]